MTEVSHSLRRTWPALVAALVLGTGAGALDVGARNVQGPLLILMAAAFVVGITRRAPAWTIGLLVSLGLLIAHAIAALAGAEGPSWGMLIALAPVTVAAYAGSLAGALIDRAGLGIPFRAPGYSSMLLLAGLGGCAVAGVVPVYGSLIARAQPVAWWVATWWQIATFVAWVALLPLVLAVHKRSAAPDGSMTLAQLAVHVAIVVPGAAVHALSIVALTRLLFVPLGAASFSVATGWAFTAYLPLDALAYTVVLALAHASDHERRERAARAELDRARLTALEAQIRPHFLFNALNSAVVLAKQGPSELAASVLTGLAEMLRYVLDESTSTVTLEQELEFIARYLAIEQVRLGDRLQWRADASDDARRMRVPRLLLQPLVENAVIHGVANRLHGGEILVTARNQGELLHLTIEDNGPGAAEVTRNGIGIANTRARLTALYGRGGTLELRPRPGGGCVVEVVVPHVAERAARSA